MAVEDPREQVREIVPPNGARLAELLHVPAFEEFKDMEEDRKLMYSKMPSELSEYKSDEVLISDDFSLEDLVKAFMAFQQRKELDKPLNTVITRKEYSVHARSRDIMKRLSKNKEMKFEELFDIRSRDYIVVTFLAILDLAKGGKLKIRQDKNLDTITLFAE